VHSDPFLFFMETAWEAWRSVHGERDALPMNWPVRSFRQQEPEAIDGKLGFYSIDAATPITEGTWRAARASANVALTGGELVSSGERGVFALCRPPGHHAARDLYGGYCFLNNAAIAAHRFVDQGAKRVAILDIDYHHGNGTQSIFYERSDVFFVSIHGDPRQEFPYYVGYDDEKGEGAGYGYNHNYPLPWGTTGPDWLAALDDGVAKIGAFRPEALVVSLGVDAFEGDPISHFRLASEDFRRAGERIGKLGLPTLFVFEGGYAVEAIGKNAVNVLEGFESQSK
jgi:acetoin utilization deacetylase AcuC-like enzyme